MSLSDIGATAAANESYLPTEPGKVGVQLSGTWEFTFLMELYLGFIFVPLKVSVASTSKIGIFCDKLNRLGQVLPLFSHVF